MNQRRLGDRRALMIGAAVVAVGLIYARGVRPAMAHLAQGHATLQEQRDLLGRERALLADSARLPDAQRKAASILNAELPRLFTGDSVSAIADLTSFTTDVANSTGVRLTTVEGRPPRVEHGIVQLAVEVRGEGTWRQVLLFVHSLEASRRLVNISAVRVERGARGGPLGGALVSVTATVVGYTRGTP